MSAGAELVVDPDAAAKVLCAYRGEWDWRQLSNKAKERYRYEAREIAEAYAEQTTDGHMPLLYDVGIGIDFGGASTPPCR